jgi:hypothetical protein
MKTLLLEQMELTGGNNSVCLIDSRASRVQRSRAWFARMRETVKLALPARPTPVPPPEQNYLPLGERIIGRGR